MLSEKDVSKSAIKFIRWNYDEGDEYRYQFEPVRWDGTRPDAVLVLEWCRGKRDRVHTIESKRDYRALISWDRRKVAPAVAQARRYSGNYRWLAVSHESFGKLTRDEEIQLKKDCRRTKHNVGLLVCWKTKSELLVEPGYWPRDWLCDYVDEPWLAGWDLSFLEKYFR